MTGENEVTHETAPHEESYAKFMWWFKSGTVAVVIIVAAVIFIITR
jgi:hypothetical protein